jgi:hypothetical protein
MLLEGEKTFNRFCSAPRKSTLQNETTGAPATPHRGEGIDIEQAASANG